MGHIVTKLPLRSSHTATPYPVSIFNLPQELWVHILRFIDNVADLASISATCKKSYQITLRHLYEYDAKYRDCISITWAFGQGRLETVWRAMALDIDIFNLRHLASAARLGDLDLVKSLLENEHLHSKLSSRNHSDYWPVTPLVAATRHGHVQIVQLLLDHGVDTEFSLFGTEETALFHALAQGCDEVALLLIRHRIQAGVPEAASYYAEAVAEFSRVFPFRTMIELRGDTSIDSFNVAALTAIHKRSYECLKVFLEAGGNPNCQPHDTEMLLDAAATCGSFEMFQLLIHHGAIVDQRNDRGGGFQTLLHLSRNVDITRWLLQQGFPVDILSAQDEPPVGMEPFKAFTPLCDALRDKKTMIATVLLDAGADPNLAGTDEHSALHLACFAGLPALIPRLVKAGCSLSAKTKTRKSTPLYTAVAENDLLTIRQLLDLGADPNELAGNYIAMHIAADTDVVMQLLIKYGADVNLKDAQGLSSLEFTTYLSFPRNVMAFRNLVTAGADVTVRDNLLNGILHRIINESDYKKDERLLREALKWDIDVECRNIVGYTPLHLACVRPFPRAAMCLLEHGADIHATCNSLPVEETSLTLAMQSTRHRGLLTALLRAGAVPPEKTDIRFSKRSHKLVRLLQRQIDRETENEAEV